MVSVPLFALEACMAARRVQTGFVPAVAHTLLVGLELATSAVLFTTKVCTAPPAGTPPPKRKAAPTRAGGSFPARRRWIIGACAPLSRLQAAARGDGDDKGQFRNDPSPTEG